MQLLSIIFCGIFCVACVLGEKINISIPSAQTLELRKNSARCAEEAGLEPTVIRKLLSWTFPNDKPHKQFLYCLSSSSGYIDKDGHYVIENMKQLIPATGTTEEYIKIIEDCNKTTLENNLDTAYEMLACFHRYYIPSVV